MVQPASRRLVTEAALATALANVTPGGGLVVLLEQSTGYCRKGSMVPVTTPVAGESYIFKGATAPPFNRDEDPFWIVVDRGAVTTPVTLSLVSSDDFNTGKNLATPAAQPLDANKWGGETTFFRQGSDGTFVPTGWTSSSRNYVVFDKTQAPTAKMRAEFQFIGYSSTTTQRTLRIMVNVTSPTATSSTFTGYGISMSTTATGSTEDWTVARLENGAGVLTVGTTTRARVAAPRSVVVESDGRGAIKVTVDGAVLNGGAAFVDPSTTPLTGRYAGITGYGQTNSADPSMNAKGEAWRLYA